jgi:hypothetical protein
MRVQILVPRVLSLRSKGSLLATACCAGALLALAAGAALAQASAAATSPPPSQAPAPAPAPTNPPAAAAPAPAPQGAGAAPSGAAPAAAPAGSAVPASGTDAPPADSDTRALDEQTQALKKDVVDLNRDLYVLEEELLYPANTQVAVFLSVDVGSFFGLDSVQLKIDQKEVANYLYTPREVDALLKGGVQRLYIGNLKTGSHEIVAFFSGKGPNARDYRRGASVKFDKSIGAHYLELKIDDRQHALQPEFEIKDWGE